jgi:hypothetical protein
MPEEINFSLGNMQSDPNSINRLKAESIQASKESKFPHIYKNVSLCLKDIITHINNDLEVDPYVKSQLIKRVKVYPDKALPKFVNSIPNQIKRIREEKRIKSKKARENGKEKNSKKEDSKENI